MSGFGRKGLDTLGGNRAPIGNVPQAFAVPSQAQRMAESSAQKFDVTPKPFLMLVTIIFFAGLAVFSGYQIVDPRGITINRIIELGPLGADIFFGVLTLIMLAMAGAGVMGLLSSLTGKTWITVDDHAVTAPKSPFNSQPVRLAFASISDMSLSAYNGKHTVVIKDRQGQKARIGEANFRDKNGFEDFMDLFGSRLEARG